MDLKGCRNVFLLVTLGAAAISGDITAAVSKGRITLTCTYEATHSPAGNIEIRWWRPGESKLTSDQSVIDLPAKFPQYSSAIGIPPKLVSYQNIGTLFYSCIVEEYDQDGWPLRIIGLERWVLSKEIVKALQVNPAIYMLPEGVLEDRKTMRLTCAYNSKTRDAANIKIKWYLRQGFALLLVVKQNSTEEEGKSESWIVVKQTIEREVTAKNDNGAEYICIITDGYGDQYLLSTVLEVKPKYTTTTPDLTTSRDVSDTTTRPSTSFPSMAGTGKAQASDSRDSTLQAVTLTLIFILVAAVIVLAVFLIRMKRNITEKPPEDSGSRPHDDFDEYAHPGGPSRSDDIYRSLGKGRRIPGQMNAAFEPEGEDYIDVFEKGGQPMTSDPQGRLEDGLRDGTIDTPVYMVLDPDAVAENDEEEAAIPSLYPMEGTGIATSSLGGRGAPARVAPSAAGKGRPPQDGYILAGAFKKKPGTDTDDYSRPYGRPPPQKATPGTKIAANYLPMTGLQMKPTTMLKAEPRDLLDASDDYAEPDGSFPSGPNAFPNGSNAGHDQPATEEDDDYNRLNLPKATKKLPLPAKPGMPRVSNPDKTADDDYSQPYGRAKMAAKGWQGNDGDDYNRLELPHLADPKSMVGLQKVVKTPKTSHSADGIPEDDEDDYEKACDVIQ